MKKKRSYRSLSLIFLIIIFVSIFYLSSAWAQLPSLRKNILGQPFYLLAEKEAIYPDHSFRQVFEACLICLHILDYKLKAANLISQEHILLALARTKINQFRFMSQENQGTRAPDPQWVGEGRLFLQIHISEEIYGLAVSFKLGTDRSSNQNRTSAVKAERMLEKFINALDEILKDPSRAALFDLIPNKRLY